MAARQPARMLFENTPGRPARPLENGKIVADTADGHGDAPSACFIAVNAYGTRTRAAESTAHVMPIGSFIGATEPLADPTAVLPGGEACDDSRFVVRYFRKSGDGRLLFGGREAYTPATGDIGRHIRKQIAEVYPHLANVEITPCLGRLGRHHHGAHALCARASRPA